MVEELSTISCPPSPEVWLLWHLQVRKEDVSRQQAILKQPSGSAQEQELKDIEDKIKASEEELRAHKEEANSARDYYNHMIKACRAQWEEINALSMEEDPSQGTVSKLMVAKQYLHLGDFCWLSTK